MNDEPKKQGEDAWQRYSESIARDLVKVPVTHRPMYRTNALAIERLARELVGMVWPADEKVLPHEALNVSARFIRLVAHIGPIKVADWIDGLLRRIHGQAMRRRKKTRGKTRGKTRRGKT